MFQNEFSIFVVARSNEQGLLEYFIAIGDEAGQWTETFSEYSFYTDLSIAEQVEGGTLLEYKAFAWRQTLEKVLKMK